MADSGLSGKQFQTAARRRRGEPVVLTIDDWQVDDEYQDGHEVTITIRIVPHLDVVRFGSMFGQFARMLSSLQDANVTDNDRLAHIDEQFPAAKARFRDCIIPPDRPGWDTVADDVDVTMLGQMIGQVSRELSGVDPTQPASSSTGSDTTSITSTDGAQPAESISAESPSPVG